MLLVGFYKIAVVGDCMKFIIDSCVRMFGVKYLSERKLIESDLDFYSIIFKSSNNECCKLEVFYNDTDVFRTRRIRNVNMLAKSDSFKANKNNMINKILSNIEVYPSLAEARAQMIANPSNMSLSKHFSKFRENIQELVFGISVPGITIHSVKFYFKPTLAITIIYLVNGVLCSPIIVTLGKYLSLITESEPEKEFVEELNRLFSNPIQFY